MQKIIKKHAKVALLNWQNGEQSTEIESDKKNNDVLAAHEVGSIQNKTHLTVEENLNVINFNAL